MCFRGAVFTVLLPVNNVLIYFVVLKEKEKVVKKKRKKKHIYIERETDISQL